MKILFVTYCTGKKRTYPERYAPAINRYDSLRIERIYEMSLEKGADFAILSGKYGLIRAHTMIPWYDKKLEAKDIDKVAELVKNFLKREKIKEVAYYEEETSNEDLTLYKKCIKKPCDELNIKFKEYEIPKLPQPKEKETY